MITEYPWIKINRDATRLARFAAIVTGQIPGCPVGYLLQASGDVPETLMKRSEVFFLKDDQHEAAISFIYKNALEMWKLAQLAFEGELNAEIFAKYRDIICSFMREKRISRLYTYRPKLTPRQKMAEFFQAIERSVQWKLEPEDVVADDDRGSTWILKSPEVQVG